jgi:hypothetical protein
MAAMRKLFPIAVLTAIPFAGQVNAPAPEYHIYAGSTHAHTAYTWSHGEQWAKSDCAGIQVYAPNPAFPGISTWSDGYVKSKTGCAGIFVIDSLQYPSPGMTLKPNWTEVQGLPSKHFELAKKNGYDFYATTDHSQESGFQASTAWADTKKQAAAASGSEFQALAGFEYSENDGPGGVGHINVFNTAGMLNALTPGIDLPYFYKWLKTAPANGDGPVVASFNHPGADQYNNWDYRDPQVTDIITMLEVINSNNKIHYDAFVHALDKGWKVSPVCGNDNHGLTGIAKNTSRTFVLAKEKTKAAILDAMKNRRTYASLAKNLQCRYTVNRAIMGSTLDRPNTFQFQIAASDTKDRITQLDIVKDGGAVVQTFTPPPGNSIVWNPEITDSSSKYFFVRVWTASGGDAPGADPAKPVAWLAPVWTGR